MSRRKQRIVPGTRMFWALRLSLFLVVLSAGLNGAAGADRRAVLNAEGWLGGQQNNINQALRAAGKELREIENLIEQANNLAAGARARGNTQAEQVALQAAKVAAQARDKIKARINRLEHDLDVITAHLARTTAEEFRTSDSWHVELEERQGLTTLVRGRVECLDGQAGWRPLYEEQTLDPGQKVRTGPDGHIRVYFPDGQHVDLGPNTVFQYSKETPREAAWELFKGSMRYVTGKVNSLHPAPKKDRTIKTPVDANGIRGTDFELRVEDSGLSHLIPYSGVVDIDVFPGKIDRQKLDRWWELLPSAPGVPLPAGKLARLFALKGPAVIEDSHGQKRPAAPGDLLAAGDRLMTGPQALAHLDLPGYSMSLAGGTRLEPGLEGKTQAPCYKIPIGKFHVVRQKAPETLAKFHAPLFRTPNAVASIRGTEFTGEVSSNRLLDFVALDGSVSVEATQDALDMNKIDAWWER